jgi:hypothetical protein
MRRGCRFEARASIRRLAVERKSSKRRAGDWRKKEAASSVEPERGGEGEAPEKIYGGE